MICLEILKKNAIEIKSSLNRELESNSMLLFVKFSESDIIKLVKNLKKTYNRKKEHFEYMDNEYIMNYMEKNDLIPFINYSNGDCIMYGLKNKRLYEWCHEYTPQIDLNTKRFKPDYDEMRAWVSYNDFLKYIENKMEYSTEYDEFEIVRGY